MKRVSGMIVFGTLFALCLAAQAETQSMPKAKFLDKCKGAWAGQIIGVCYGDIYEFRTNGVPMLDDIREWKPEFVVNSIGQDDLYVEMTFLKAIEDHGLDVTYEQAGKAFAESKYPLWHANRVGRENVRRGIMPPASGHPDHNVHADDIDFQIEADVFGILCPGMPQEAERLCDPFGHIMNYADGYYGGVFVAAMYSAAYFEDKDINKVVQAGLDSIPKESDYHKCISDVVKWYAELPNDWLAVWRKIEEKWQDNVDCDPAGAFNIDAKLNGAYIVMGLLYGQGNADRTLEVSLRCGQDNDCNPSNAMGVLGCMLGFDAIPKQYTSGMGKMENTKFDHTDYSYTTLIPTCVKITENIIQRAGGKVSGDTYEIAMQPHTPPKTVEIWSVEDQKKRFVEPLPQSEIDNWQTGWRVVACGRDMQPGMYSDLNGRPKVLLIHPVKKEEPAIIERMMDVPTGTPKLKLEVASNPDGDHRLVVKADEKVLLDKEVDTKGQWITLEADLSAFAGKKIALRIENHATGWKNEAAYIAGVEVK